MGAYLVSMGTCTSSVSLSSPLVSWGCTWTDSLQSWATPPLWEPQRYVYTHCHAIEQALQTRMLLSAVYTHILRST